MSGLTAEQNSPAVIGGCGLKPLTPNQAVAWLGNSPAVIGGCGLKPPMRRSGSTHGRKFTRRNWRVRIETWLMPLKKPAQAEIHPP